MSSDKRDVGLQRTQIRLGVWSASTLFTLNILKTEMNLYDEW